MLKFCIKQSHQDLHCLASVFDFKLKSLFASVDMSKFKDGRVFLKNSGIELTHSNREGAFFIRKMLISFLFLNKNIFCGY